MAEGEFALVRHILEPALERPAESIGDHDLYAMLADVAAQQGDLAAIRRFAPQAEALSARYGHLLYQAIAHRAWGVAHRLAGELAGADTRLHHALALFSQLNTPWQIARTLSELGQLSLAQGDTTAARGFFIRALSGFEALRSAPAVAQTHALLESLQ